MSLADFKASLNAIREDFKIPATFRNLVHFYVFSFQIQAAVAST